MRCDKHLTRSVVFWRAIAGRNRETQGASFSQVYNSQIKKLQGKDAHHVAVVNLPNFQNTPGGIRAGRVGSLLGHYSINFNQWLNKEFEGLSVIPINAAGLFNEIQDKPLDFGFKNIEDWACPDGERVGQALRCGHGPGYEVQPFPNKDEFLFADSVHPSGATHELLGNAVIATLTAPLQVSLAGELGIATWSNHLDTVATERVMNLNSITSTSGIGPFAHLNFVTTDFGDLPTVSTSQATARSASIGTDILGGSNSFMGISVGFSNAEADDKLKGDTVVVALHGGVQTGDLYAGIGLGLGQTDLDISRHISLGEHMRVEQGSTKASQTAVDIEAGWRRDGRAFGHGVFVGARNISQTVESYREGGQSPTSTALDYSEFEANSTTVRVGYQISGAPDAVTNPSLRLAYEYELNDDPVSIEFGSRTMSGRATVDGYQRPQGRVLLGAGVQMAISDNLSATIGYSGRFGENSVNSHGFATKMTIRF